MKKIYAIVAVALAAFTMTGLQSCGESKKDTKSPEAKTEAKTAGNLPNYRYVDLDSVLTKYNLAKDYNEELMRMQSNYESAAKSHQTKLQNFATTVQNKMQNNGYLSEASYKQDEQTMANMQNDAQRSMANLQASIEQAAMKGQQLSLIHI